MISRSQQEPMSIRRSLHLHCILESTFASIILVDLLFFYSDLFFIDIVIALIINIASKKYSKDNNKCYAQT